MSALRDSEFLKSFWSLNGSDRRIVLGWLVAKAPCEYSLRDQFDLDDHHAPNDTTWTFITEIEESGPEYCQLMLNFALKQGWIAKSVTSSISSDQTPLEIAKQEIQRRGIRGTDAVLLAILITEIEEGRDMVVTMDEIRQQLKSTGNTFTNLNSTVDSLIRRGAIAKSDDGEIEFTTLGRKEVGNLIGVDLENEHDSD